MELRTKTVFMMLFLIALLAAGCSRGSSVPVMPSNPDPGNTIANLNGEQPMVGAAAFGTFDAVIDKDSMTLEFTPLRNSSEIGDSQSLDIAPYLQSDPCRDCFKVTGFGIDADGKVFMDAGIKHPFAAGGSRLDLDVFDVRLIIIVQGSETFSLTMRDGVAMSGNFTFLTNADGYTSFFDDGLGGPYPGTLNPFINFFTEDDPAWDVDGQKIANHRMAMGADYDYKRLFFNIPSGGTYPFRMVIEASYGQSAKKSILSGEPGSRDNPKYYIPEFNRKDLYSFRVNADEIEYGTSPSVIIDLEALDWQVGAHVGSAYPQNQAELIAPSGVQDVSLEIPSLTFFSTNPTSTTGTGVAGDPLHFNFKVPMSAMSVYPFLAAARDERDDMVDNLDVSAYQYGQINTFISTGANKSITHVYTNQYDTVLGERSIAVDGDYVYITWCDIQNMKGYVYCARSVDGGATFDAAVKASDSNHEDSKMHPTIAVDKAHTVYIAWEDYGNLNPFSDAGDIFMAKSVNNGASFSQNVRVNDFEDVADDSQEFPTLCTKGTGNLYVVWVEKPTATTFRHIRLARSTDGGTTFLPEIVISDELPRLGDPAMGVNENGVVWIAWRDYRNSNQDIFATRSVNSGASFGPQIKVNDDPGIEYQASPSVAVDSSGIGYVVWVDSRDPGRNDFDVYFAYSTGSSSFSANKRVNRIQNVAFQPSIALTDEGGIYVIYQDMRDDGLGDIYVTGSLDFGRTFSINHDVKLNDDAGPSIQLTPQIAIGSDGHLYFAWGDGRGNDPRVYYAKSIFP